MRRSSTTTIATALICGVTFLLALLPACVRRATPLQTSSQPQGSKLTPRRPNILLALADDASFPHMSAYGTSWVRSPAFDRVAREGLLFTRAYTPNAKCAPSRANLLTGRHSWQLEAAGNHLAYFPEKFTTYVEGLSENGYAVGRTGKGWAPGNPGTRNGALRDLAGPNHTMHKLSPPTKSMSSLDYAANFAAFLDARPKDAPFAFWYGGMEPHRRYEYESGVRKGGKRISDVTKVPGFLPDADVVRHDLLDYAFEIEHFDRHLGLMLKELEARGELHNTLVVVTSDNGMPFPRAKGQSYEYSHHVPLAIMWPEGIQQPGRVVEDFVSFVDFAPTFLELAGLSAEQAGMQPMVGQSLLDVFAGKPKRPRAHLLIGKERHDAGRPRDVGYPVRGIISGQLLYLRNYETDRWPAGNPETGYLNTDGGPTKTFVLSARREGKFMQHWQWAFGKRQSEELYNLSNDPDCLVNLAADASLQGEKQRLAAQMQRELRAQGDPRMAGQGHVFDDYPISDEFSYRYYERFMKGEVGVGSWVDATDYEPQPLD